MAKRVKFSTDLVFENVGRNEGHTYKSGEEYVFDEPFAQHGVFIGAFEALGDASDADVARFTAAKPLKAAKAPAADQA